MKTEMDMTMEIIRGSRPDSGAHPKQREKPYDLEERTYEFARDIRDFIRLLPKTLSNREDAIQLVRSSGQLGACYIEANDALSKKDFLASIKLCRKEAKESRYWLALFDTEEDDEASEERERMIEEAQALTNIFGAILRNSNRNQREHHHREERPPRRDLDEDLDQD